MAVYKLLTKNRLTGRLINSSKLLSKYFSDAKFRTDTALSISVCFNLAYAVFHLASNIIYGNIPSGAMGIYYAILFISRYSLLKNGAKASKIRDEVLQSLYKKRISRQANTMLALLNIIVFTIMLFGIRLSRNKTQPGFFNTVSSLYVIYRIIVLAIRTKSRQSWVTPVHRAAWRLDLSIALMGAVELIISA